MNDQWQLSTNEHSVTSKLVFLILIAQWLSVFQVTGLAYVWSYKSADRCAAIMFLSDFVLLSNSASLSCAMFSQAMSSLLYMFDLGAFYVAVPTANSCTYILWNIHRCQPKRQLSRHTCWSVDNWTDTSMTCSTQFSRKPVNPDKHAAGQSVWKTLFPLCVFVFAQFTRSLIF